MEEIVLLNWNMQEPWRKIKKVICINSIISSLQELSMLIFLLPFPLDAHAFLQTHPTLAWTQIWTFNLN